MLQERVSEAIRVAMIELKEEQLRAKGGKRGFDEANAEGGNSRSGPMKTGYAGSKGGNVNKKRPRR